MVKKHVLVIGVTGNQGGHVARKLLREGHSVRGMTRKPDGAVAKEIKKLGAEIVQGDLNDRASIERACKGMDVVFGMSSPFEKGTRDEVQQGKTLVQACKASKVPHVVFSSAASADKKTGIPHFDSKADIEKTLRDSGLSYTVLGPTFFMENLLSPKMFPTLKKGELRAALPQKRSLQMIALDDLAGVVAHIVADPKRFAGQRIDLASDELSAKEIAETLGKATKRTITFVPQPIDEVKKASPDMAKMFEWFEKEGMRADVTRLRKDFPEVGWHRFEPWAKAQDWSKALAIPAGAR